MAIEPWGAGESREWEPYNFLAFVESGVEGNRTLVLNLPIG